VSAQLVMILRGREYVMKTYADPVLAEQHRQALRDMHPNWQLVTRDQTKEEL
jgi:hypothetical protein